MLSIVDLSDPKIGIGEYNLLITLDDTIMSSELEVKLIIAGELQE